MSARTRFPLWLLVAVVACSLLIPAQSARAHDSDFGRILMGAAGAALLYSAFSDNDHCYRHRPYRYSDYGYGYSSCYGDYSYHRPRYRHHRYSYSYRPSYRYGYSSHYGGYYGGCGW